MARDQQAGMPEVAASGGLTQAKAQRAGFHRAAGKEPWRSSYGVPAAGIEILRSLVLMTGA